MNQSSQQKEMQLTNFTRKCREVFIEEVTPEKNLNIRIGVYWIAEEEGTPDSTCKGRGKRESERALDLLG